ncbi:MAG: hypothetical protein KDA68_14325 [Planctomycetaceae bacterium]|nr:hypothetical protein [Planctomycetaceae bacterium]MCA9094659.1 hypothetical protein [Planctomycetaceae bacterium]
MSSPTANDRLNDLLITINRSLLQYAMESWLWSSDATDSLLDPLKQAAAKQQHDVERLAGFLTERRHRTSFGTFPATYTSLHYVAVGFLVSRILANQRDIVSAIESSLSMLSTDIEARELGNAILRSQKECLDLIKGCVSEKAEHAHMITS